MSDPTLIHDTVAAPLGDVIASVGAGVAAAQHALDEASLAAVLELYAESDDERIQLLQAIGYRPTFYALPETTGEVKVSLTLSGGATAKGTGVAAGTSTGTGVRPVPNTPLAAVSTARLGLNQLPARLYATPVDAGYSNQYGYTANISATLTFRIVPIPPPQGAEDLRVVPDLVGRTVAASRETLTALGLGARVPEPEPPGGTPPDGPPPGGTAADAREVTAQSPAAGTIGSAGDEVTLTVATA